MRFLHTVLAILLCLVGAPLTVSAEAVPTAASSYTFTRDLTIDSVGEDVRALQRYLNSQGFTVATSGVGSPGNETTTFWYGTRDALLKFQKAKGLTATGVLDSATRTHLRGGTLATQDATLASLIALVAKLQAELAILLAERGIVTPELGSEIPAGATFTRDLTLDSVGEDVRALQRYLNSQGFTVATSGVGSPGNETTTFWIGTKEALKKFQRAKGIPATGYFGETTRAYIVGTGSANGKSKQSGGGGGGGSSPVTPAQGSQGSSGGTPVSGGGGTDDETPDTPEVGTGDETPEVLPEDTSDATPPSTPGNLIAVAVSPSQINLLWIASTDNVGVVEYRIYLDGEPTPGATVSVSGVVGIYQFIGLSPGTQYSFTVRALDVAGNLSLPAQVSATTKLGIGVGLVPDTTPPSKVGNLSASAVSQTEVSISWSSATDNVGVAGYRVYRNGKLLVTLAVVTSHTDSNLKPGTAYTYTVETLDTAGNASGQTTGVTATTDSAPEVSTVDPAPALYAKKVIPTATSLSTTYVQDLYRLIFNREPDALGLRGHIVNIAKGSSYLSTMRAFVGSQEFLDKNPTASSYVDRLYSHMLGRGGDEPSRTTLIEMIENSTDRAEKMLEAYNIFAYSTEYEAKCPTSYHTYDRKLKSDSPRLADIVSGAARFETITESEEVRLRFNSRGGPLWDQKMPMVKDPNSGDYYAVTRLYQPRYKDDFKYNLFLMKSTDGGVTFSEVGPIFDAGTGSDVFYDGHIAIDYSVCPNQYVLVYECKMDGLESFSTCVSRTTDITNPNAWTPPQVLIEGCDANPGKGCASSKVSSASTPVIMIEGDRKYVAWAVVEQIDGWKVGRVYTRGMEITDFSRRAGYANQGTVLMDSEVNTGDLVADSTRTPWDWNNRNVADWRKESGEYLMTYAGGNYFGCARESALPLDISSTDPRAIVWGIGAGKSSRALAPYSTPSEANIKADKFDSCAITYNNVNNINGELYLYYSVNSVQAGISTLRSKLIWK